MVYNLSKMFDTHCHLNFSVFKKILPKVIDQAKKTGINQILIPGTDVSSSLRAVEIASQYENVYPAVGIHPHHIMQYQKDSAKQFLSQRTSPSKKRDPRSEKIAFASSYKKDLVEIEKLLFHPKVVAIGEVGLDKHQYQKTKYQNYQINSEFIEDQKELLKIQIQLAIKHDKSLIIHNWEAGIELLDLLNKTWDERLEGRTVFHCCEPNKELLNYAKEHRIYIGVDGDVTYSQEKQDFVKQIPLEMLVLETDSPYLLPEPLRGQKLYPNEPKNVSIIAEYIAKITNTSINRLIELTTKNAKKLFSIV